MTRSLPVVLLLLALPGVGLAQERHPGEDPREDPGEPPLESLDDEAARLTYLAGREAFARGDYETALERFQQAYELSPRVGLLYNIARSYQQLGQRAEAIRAVNQYIELATDEGSRATGRALRRELGDAPPPPPPQASRPPLHPALFLGAAGLAAVAGGLSIWTGLETIAQNDAYQATVDPTDAAAAYDSASNYQLGTNVLLFSAGAFAVAAVVFAFFTDWDALDGERADGPQLSLAATPNGGAVALAGAF